MCCVKCDTFPLNINPKKKKLEKKEVNLDFIKNFLPRLDYNALVLAANELNIKGLPEKLPENIEKDEKALASLHELLVEVMVEEGELVCPKCKREYPIKNGILNMLLREDEVDEKIEENEEK